MNTISDCYNEFITFIKVIANIYLVVLLVVIIVLIYTCILLHYPVYYLLGGNLKFKQLLSYTNNKLSNDSWIDTIFFKIG